MEIGRGREGERERERDGDVVVGGEYREGKRRN